MQGGVQNFLGQQPTVNAPKYWQSAPNHEMTELAYITPRERDVLVDMDMYGTMSGGPNRGPSGLMSLNGWGSRDPSQNRPGADISAAMDRSGSDPGWSPGSGGGGSSAVAAQTISPAQLQLFHEQKGGSTVLPESTFGRTYQPPRRGMGNFFSGLGRGIGNLAMMFNPFTAAAGIMGNPKTAMFMNMLGRGKNRLQNLRRSDGQLTDQDYWSDENRYRRQMEAFRERYGKSNVQGAIDRDWTMEDTLKELPITSNRLQELKGSQFASPYDDMTGDVAASKMRANVEFPYEQFSRNEVDEGINTDIDPMTFAKVTGPALIQMRELEKKQARALYGGPELTANEERILKEQKKRDADQENIYSSMIV